MNYKMVQEKHRKHGHAHLGLLDEALDVYKGVSVGVGACSDVGCIGKRTVQPLDVLLLLLVVYVVGNE